MADDAPIPRAEEVRTLLERSLARAERLLSERRSRRGELPPGSPSPMDDATLALAFAARAAGALGDPSLLPLVLRGHRLMMKVDEWWTRGPLETAAAGVAELVRARRTASPEAAGLAVHPDPLLRAALAWGLRAEDPSARPLLEALARDPVPRVRNAAAQRLRANGEVPWWWGSFQSDPAQRLTAADADRYRPALEQVHELLAGDWVDRPKLAEAMRGLPDVLASELAERLLGGAGFGVTPELLAELWRRPGAAEATRRLCDRWQRNGEHPAILEYTASGAAALLPEDARARLARGLLEVAQDLPRDDVRSAGAQASACIVGLWARGEDLGPVLEVILASPPLPGGRHDYFASHLGRLFSAPDANLESIAEQLLAAAAENFPGPWQRASWAKAACERLPTGRLREVAERALSEGDATHRRWALPVLLGPAYDPERDPPRPELVRRFFQDLEGRAICLDHPELRQLALPLIRAELRAGRFGADQIHDAVAAIGSVFGGVASPFTPPENLAEQRSQRIAELEPFLGPAELRGPPTDAEWELWRAARKTLPDKKRWRTLFDLLPKGAWDPADRELLDEALAGFRAGDRRVGFLVAGALAAKPRQEDLSIFRELAAHVAPNDLEHVEHWERTAREWLGLPPVDEAGAAPVAPTAVDWLDEDD